MRRVYLWLALAVMALAIYGSLLPFDQQWRPIAPAWSTFMALLANPPAERLSRTNFLANILLFVPFGFCLMGARLADRAPASRTVAAFAVLVASVLVSTLAEFAQVFARDRIPTRLDIAAQTIGCALGIAAWIAAGPSLTTWLRESRLRMRSDRLARALGAYAALWVFAGLVPFDITVDVGELGRRLRSGMINVVPFGSPMPAWQQVWHAVPLILISIPLGLIGLIGWRHDSRRRSAAAAWALGATAVAALEGVQIFIRSHAADITDVLCGWLGVVLGVWVGTRLPEIRSAPIAPIDRRRLAVLVATGVWALVICGYHWQPFDFSLDPLLVRDKLANISLVPFAGYRAGSDPNALNSLLSKTAVAAPLGTLASFAARGLAVPGRVLLAMWLAAATAFFGAVEAGQFFVPSRDPDPTDTLVGVAASLAGWWLGRRLQQRR
jgi:VanZ family protein